MQQRGFTHIILVLVLLVLVGGGAYYLGKNGAFTSPVSIPTSSHQLVANTPLPEETKDGEIYTNNKHNFSIKIPQGYFIGECVDGTTILIGDSEQSVICEKGVSGLVLHISDKDNSSDEISSLNKEYSGTSKSITVDTIKGRQFEGNRIITDPAPIPPHIISSFFNKNNNFYQFSYYDNGNGVANQLYFQILSTFKFIP